MALRSGANTSVNNYGITMEKKQGHRENGKRVKGAQIQEGIIIKSDIDLKWHRRIISALLRLRLKSPLTRLKKRKENI